MNISNIDGLSLEEGNLEKIIVGNTTLIGKYIEFSWGENLCKKIVQSQCEEAKKVLSFSKVKGNVHWISQLKTTEFGNWIAELKDIGSGEYGCEIRYINRNKWKKKSIDATRELTQNEKENYKTCIKENNIDNAWIVDDLCRDHFNMDTSALNFVTVVDSKSKALSLTPGRYIFVLKKDGNNTLLVRKFDRSHLTSDTKDSWCDYRYYLFLKNIKSIKGKNYLKTVKFIEGVSTIADVNELINYNLHVRHSQLNGGWDDVWSAGELWVKKIEVNEGKFESRIIAISNESGHFKPSFKSLKYVEENLNYLGIPTENLKLYHAIKKNELDTVINAELDAELGPTQKGTALDIVAERLERSHKTIEKREQLEDEIEALKGLKNECLGGKPMRAEQDRDEL